MKKLLLLVVALSLLVSFSWGQKSSLLWKVSKKGVEEPSYLYGTIHLQDKRVFEFDGAVYNCMKNCDVLAVELVMDQLDQAEVMKLMQLEEGTIQDYLTQEQYQTLDSLFKEKTGMGVGLYSKMTPFFFSSMFLQMDLPKDMPMALDAHLIDTARKMNLEVVALETLEVQIGAINKMSTQDQVDMLMKGITVESDEVTKMFDEMVFAYTHQDLDQLNSLLQDSTLPKEFQEDLLIGRNYGMADKIGKMMKKKQSVFAAFGAGHLVGDKGVIELLRKKGFDVVPVTIDFKTN